jgi:ferredoxin
MKIIADFDLCESHARCVEAAPDMFEIRDDDIIYLPTDHLDEDHRRAVETRS